MSVYLRQGLCLCCLLLVVACKPGKPVEALVSEYWTALAQGDIRVAYGFLSSADRQYIDPEAFKTYLLGQPALDFLLLPPEHLATGLTVTSKKSRNEEEAAEAAAFVHAEVTNVSVNGNRARALLRVRTPDLESWLGKPLAANLHGASGNLETEMQLLRRLQLPPVAPPSKHNTHTLNLVRERQGWRVSYPRWRAQAMLVQAKRLSADKDLDGALSVLERLSGFADTLDQVTKLDLIRDARRGRRMLPYLRDVRLADFRRTGAVSGCPETAKLQVTNYSGLAVKTTSGVIAFLNANKRVLGSQMFELEHPDPITPKESATFTLCLKPPKGWSGEAEAWVSWLVFTDEAYQHLMR